MRMNAFDRRIMRENWTETASLRKFEFQSGQLRWFLRRAERSCTQQTSCSDIDIAPTQKYLMDLPPMRVQTMPRKHIMQTLFLVLCFYVCGRKSTSNIISLFTSRLQCPLRFPAPVIFHMSQNDLKNGTADMWIQLNELEDFWFTLGWKEKILGMIWYVGFNRFLVQYQRLVSGKTFYFCAWTLSCGNPQISLGGGVS